MPRDLFPDSLPEPIDAEAADTHAVARVMALLWTYRPRTTIFKAIQALQVKRADGRAFTADLVKQVLQGLRAQQRVEEHPTRQGYYRLAGKARNELYRSWLAEGDWRDLEQALYDASDVHRDPYSRAYWPLYDREATVALLRLNLLSGAPAKTLEDMKARIERSLGWHDMIEDAVLDDFAPDLFERIAPEWRWAMALENLSALMMSWDAARLPLAEWSLRQAGAKVGAAPAWLRLGAAEWLLNRGERAAALDLLQGMQDGASGALRAFALAQEGKWSEAQTAFEAAIKLRQGEVSARKRIFPSSLAWIYPLCLLAQQTPKHLELARKFCIGESGTRAPDPHHGWGLWAHAAGSRLGEQALAGHAFVPHSNARGGLEELWRILLAAWLGVEALKLKEAERARVRQAASILSGQLAACGLHWLSGQLQAAQAVLEGREPPAGFFVAGSGARWRDVLTALQALSADKGGKEDSAESARLIWVVHSGKQAS